MLERVTNVTFAAVMKAFEKRVEEIEWQKLVVAEKIAACADALRSLDAAVRTAVAFVSNPWKLWAFGTYPHKRMC